VLPPSKQAKTIPDGERKTVTALFADIKGSTELMADLDPEEARAIIDPALRLMIDAVHRYDGYIVQSTGDGIFALFGAPVAHEDHPQRALYAALRMQEELRRYSSRLREGGDLPIEARVGVNTGEVVVRSIATGAGHTEYTPIGHTANLAGHWRGRCSSRFGGWCVWEWQREWNARLNKPWTLTNNVALTGANEGPVTIQHLLELIGPLPKGTTKERLAAQDATVVDAQAVSRWQVKATFACSLTPPSKGTPAALTTPTRPGGLAASNVRIQATGRRRIAGKAFRHARAGALASAVG
jgi:hypothetical protein